MNDLEEQVKNIKKRAKRLRTVNNIVTVVGSFSGGLVEGFNIVEERENIDRWARDLKEKVIAQHLKPTETNEKFKSIDDEANRRKRFSLIKHYGKAFVSSMVLGTSNFFINYFINKDAENDIKMISTDAKPKSSSSDKKGN
jgi:hypothetical protein